MFGPGTRVMDRNLSFQDYQSLMEMLAVDQQLNASLATPLDPIDDLLADWNSSVEDGAESRAGMLSGRNSGSEDGTSSKQDCAEDDDDKSADGGRGGDDRVIADCPFEEPEDPLFGYPNPSANFGPEFTPDDDPAPADSSADKDVPAVPSAASVAAAAAAVTLLSGRQDGGAASFGPPSADHGGVGVMCP
ncbi:unnamed protein product [Ectocarpus fasciculatus]